MTARSTLLVLGIGALVVVPAGRWLGGQEASSSKGLVLARVDGYVRVDTAAGPNESAFVLWRAARSGEVELVQIDRKGDVTRLPAMEPTQVGAVAPLVTWRGRPCVGANRATGSSVACLGVAGWSDTALPVSAVGQSVVQLVAAGPDLVVLLRDDRHPVRWSAWRATSTGWSSLPSLPRHGGRRSDLLVFLSPGTRGASRRVFAGITSAGRRAVYELTGDRWALRTRRTRYRGLPNQNSPPWSDGASILFARTELRAARAPFFVDHASPGRTLRPAFAPSLKQRRASLAQGRLLDLRGHPWVIWQHATDQGTRREQTAIFASRLSAKGEAIRIQRLGRAFGSAGPAILSLTTFGGAPHAVVARSRLARPTQVTTQITVEPLYP